MSDDGLREKAISGAKWTVLTTYLSQVVQLVTAYALTWLIDRPEYGLVAGAMAIVSILRACGNLGMNYALVQRRDRIEDATHTAFVMLIAVAVASYLVLVCVGPFTKAYAAEPTLLITLGLLFFLRPVAVVTEGTLRREFRFRRMFLVEFLSVLVSSALAITLALLLPEGRRYWALAASGLAREAMRSAVSWCCARIRPRFRFDRAVARELLHYGKYFVASAIVMALYGNIERLALIELHSADALGLYYFAFNWVFRVGDISETIFGGVAIPVYAKMQDDVPRLRTSFCRIVTYSALLSTGLLVGLTLLVADAIPLAFHTRWHATVPIFQILGIYYIVRSVDTTTGQLYAAIGKPKYNTYLGVVNLAVMSVTLWPFVVWWGPVGAAACVLVARTAQFACNVFVCRGVLECPLAALGRIVRPALVASTVMAGAVTAAQVQAMRLWGTVGWGALAGLIAIGATSFVAALAVFERALFRDILGLLRDGLRGMRARIRDQAT